MKTARAMGMSVDQKLMNIFALALHISSVQIEQWSKLSFKRVHGSAPPDFFVHERVIVFTPPVSVTAFIQTFVNPSFSVAPRSSHGFASKPLASSHFGSRGNTQL